MPSEVVDPSSDSQPSAGSTSAMAIDVSAASYESGRRALQLAADGGSSIEEIASLLAQEAEDHWNSSCVDPTEDRWGSYSRDPTEDSKFVSCDHRRALEVAASAGHMDAVERLLAAGADPNAQVHKTGRMALEAAAAQGHLDIVQKLLETGARPDYSGVRVGSSPLIAAAAVGHIEICKALLQSGADVSHLTQNENCGTPFSAVEAAVEASSIALLELFLGAVEDAAKGFSTDELKVAIAEGRQQESRKLLRTEEFLGRARLSINRALEAAAAAGSMPMLQKLLDAGADIDELNFVGGNAVAAAASGGHLEVMTKLLQIYSDQDMLHAYIVEQALQSAVSAGNIALIEPLVQNGADAKKVDIRGAVVKGHLDFLTLILQSRALVETNYSRIEYMCLWKGFTALQLAAYYGHLAIVDLLLAKGADVDEFLSSSRKSFLRISDVKGLRGATALQLAVAGGHLAVAERLMNAGADVNARHETADSPLQAAVRSGDTAMLELLLSADPVVGDGGREKTALSVAAEVDNADLVARLLSMMSPEDARQAAPWAQQEAVGNHRVDIVRQLLQLHPDVNMTRDEAKALTLLQTAAANGTLEILEMLLSEGADVNLNPSKAGLPTALQSASERGDLAAVKLLLTAGADVNVVGSTAPPLLLAIRGGHAQVFEHLLAAGADIYATSYRGQTMIEAAEDSGAADIQDRVRAALNSRPPPQRIDQPLDRGTGPLCETCRQKIWDRESIFVLHPSLIALRASAVAGCPFCCFLWKRLGITSISIPQPSPVEMAHPLENTMSVWVNEPFPGVGEKFECLRAEFPCLPAFDESYGARVPITEDTSSPETYKQIHTWLNTCKNEHPKCRVPAGKPFLPTRLIYLDTSGASPLSDAADTDLQPRLVCTNGIESSEARYIALSYRWPEDFPVEAKSNQDNVREQMRGLNTSKVLRIFNDVFQVAITMGISYVWIDSLCIIQDDSEDWNHESALMVDIYRSAEFTLAAAIPPTKPDLGLFRHGDPSDVPSVTLLGVHDPREGGSGLDVVVMKPQKEAYGESPLVSRGWCFQEREISRRIVHYTETQVIWECRTLRASEGLPGGVDSEDQKWTKRMLDHELKDVSVFIAWLRAVEDYSARDLTVFTDKLPALSGLAAAIRDYKPANCRYLAGLWEDNFWYDLQWHSQSFGDGTVMNTRYPGYIAPTWSWASVAGPISYEGSPLQHSADDEANNTRAAKYVLRVLDICVQTSTTNVFGAVKHAVLTCTAALVPGLVGERNWGALRCEVKAPDGLEFGILSWEVALEAYNRDVVVVLCINLGNLQGLALLPTGDRENEYRRVGMITKMKNSKGSNAEIKKITIV